MGLNKNINNQCLDNDTNPQCSSDVSNPTSFRRIWIYENRKKLFYLDYMEGFVSFVNHWNTTK